MSNANELEKYLNNFFNFFPFGIEQRKCLIANAYHLSMKDTQLITVFWRFFLIVNPEINGYSVEEKIWRSVLSQKRSIFTNLQKYSEIQKDDFFSIQSKETWDKIVMQLANEFLLVSGKFDKEMLDDIQQILIFFINDETPDELIEIICVIISRIYILYVNECEYFMRMSDIYMNQTDDSFKQKYSHIYDNLNFLFSKEFLHHDLYNSIKSILSMLSPLLCEKTETHKNLIYNKIVDSIKQHSPLSSIPDKSEVDDILFLYKKLFILDKAQRDSMYDLFTAIFAYCPQSTIFHIFHSWIYMNNVRLKANNISNIQTKDWILSIGVKLKVINGYTYPQKLENVQKSFQEIKDLIQQINPEDKKLPPNFNSLVKFHLHQLTRLLHDEIYWEEIIPFRSCLSQIQK